MNLRLASLPALLATFACVGIPAAVEAGDGPIELLRSTPEEVVFRVLVPEPRFLPSGEPGVVQVAIPGFGPGGEVGAPELPGRAVHLGIPANSEPTVEVTSVRTRFEPGRIPRPVATVAIRNGESDLPVQTVDYLRDPARYGEPTDTPWASLVRISQLRHLRVAAVGIQPVRWDPARQGLLIAEELEVRVRFPEIAATRGAPDRLQPRESEVWERRYERSVLNWEDARGFLRLAPRAPVHARATALGSGPEFRIDVSRTDLYQVPYASLEQAGWDLGAVPLDRLVMEERVWDESTASEIVTPVPLWVRDVAPLGEFGTGDAVVFYGLDAFDRFDPEPWVRRYGRDNAYWLTVRDLGGSQMPDSASTLGRTDLASVPSCVWTQHFEEDRTQMRITLAEEVAHPIERSVEQIKDDHYFWFGGNGTQSVTFDLPGYRSVRGLEVRLRDTYIEETGSFDPLFDFRIGETEAAAITIRDLRIVREKAAENFVFDAEDLTGIRLAERGNDFFIDQPPPTAGAWVDYMRWTYEKATRALFDRIDFDTDALVGPQQWDLSGFGGTDIGLFEVTQPTRPVRYEIAAGQITGSGNNRVARVQIDLGPSGLERRFVARRLGTLPLPDAVERASDADLGTPQRSDVVVITHPGFLDGMEPWVAHRTSQGWDVEVVTIREVFDQFNGGRGGPAAIRNFLRYAFRTRETPPSFVLLVGDASNDHAQVLSRSAADYVPTQTLFSNASSGQGPELIASDHYFVDDLVGTGNTLDFLADAAIGRLPVGNAVGDAGQLTALVDKIIRYDTVSDTDTWRNRGLFMADDEFSSRVDYDSDYRWQSSEYIFRFACREAIDRIRSGGFLDFEVDSLYLASYLDTVACLQRCVPQEVPLPPDCKDWSCRVGAGGEIVDINRGVVPGAYFATRDYANEVADLPGILRRKINRGNLFVAFEAHANRAQATHEEVWMDSDLAARYDSDRLDNVGKPFIFLGFGCHMADFAHPEENALGRGDCLVERMLFEDEGRGAVAGCASSGYEWLRDNHYPLVPFMEDWFNDPPVGPDGRTRWRLGELIDGGKEHMVETTNYDDSFTAMVPTYVLLGDPTMVIDLAPPRADLVAVDGEPWTTGAPLRAPLGNDQVTIEVRFRDEVALRDLEVLSGGAPLGAGTYEVLPDPDRPDSDGRALVRYAPTLDVPAEDYEIVFRAVDDAGRSRDVTFPVALSTSFEILRGGAFQPLDAGAVVELQDTVRVAFSSPVPVTAADIAFLSAGAPQEILEVRPEEGEAEEAWSWVVLARIGSQEPDGFDLVLEIARRNGATARRSLSVLPASDRVSVVYATNMPNPFGDETHFVYRLDGPVAGVDLTVFTRSGRKIWEATGPVLPTENYVLWDGRDREGDPVANGVYFYELRVRTLDGREIKRIDRLARVR